MPPLSRTSPRLLHTVEFKPHATRDDHYDALPTPPATNSTRSSASQLDLTKQDDEHIYDSPVSSDDDAPAPAQQLPVTKFELPRQFDGTTNESRLQSGFKQPAALSPGSSKSKRSSGSDPNSSDNEIFPSQPSPNKRLKNIHAKVKQKTYGSSKRIPSQHAEKRPQSRAAKQVEKKVTSAPTFKAAKGVDMFEFGKVEELPLPTFKCTGASHDASTRSSKSPSLSSLSSPPSSPGFEEIEHLDLPAAQPYTSKTECTACGQGVDLFLKESFEDEFLRGKQMNYKWQQRFCRYHKQHEARELWEQRGYPEIDWSGLARRMQRHDMHLEGVTSGTKPSLYRAQFTEKLNARTKISAQINDGVGAERETSVGYYGPRGEKMMTDHIITHLSDSLRKQATNDKLVSASGASGGISGFVSAVLVPELAEQLIAEDMNVFGDRPREIIAESAKLGEVLNPELDDRVTEVVEGDD